MIKRDTHAETIEELQPQIDALTENNKKLSDQNDALAKENDELTKELERYKAAFGNLDS